MHVNHNLSTSPVLEIKQKFLNQITLIKSFKNIKYVNRSNIFMGKKPLFLKTKAKKNEKSDTVLHFCKTPEGHA